MEAGISSGEKSCDEESPFDGFDTILKEDRGEVTLRQQCKCHH